MASRLPSQTQVIELLDAEFARTGYEIEDAVVDTHARPPRITVVVDGDAPLDIEFSSPTEREAELARTLVGRTETGG